MREPYLCRMSNMSWRTCIIIKQMQSYQVSHVTSKITSNMTVWQLVTANFKENLKASHHNGLPYHDINMPEGRWQLVSWEKVNLFMSSLPLY